MSTVRRLMASIVLALVVLGGVVAEAQETTGTIIGRVTSQDSATLPGVTVQIADPEVGFERVTVTNAEGEYKFVALPPGRYALTASLDGFQTYTRDLDVDLGRTVRNDFVMALGAVSDVIEVTGEAPLVDTTSTVTGLTVNTDEFSGRVPVGRESTQIALLAPGAVDSDRSFNSDYTPGQELVSVSGSSVAENSYQVNGLNVTNFRNMLGSTFVPFEFVEEVQVKTGGYEAEYGRSTGGVINMVTKSGTNSLHGGVSLYWNPEALQSTEPDSWNRHNTEEYSKSLETNASLGGALVRDKLFFFGFVRYDDTEFMHNVGTRNTVTENGAPYYGGKLDWNLTPNHRLEGTYIADDTELTRYLYEYDPETRTQGEYVGTGWQERGGENYILKYTGILTENFLLSGQYGDNQFDRTDRSTADQYNYAYDCRLSCTPVGLWVNWQIASGGDEREAYRIDADWYLGKHSLRGGFDGEKNTSTEVSTYAGGLRYVYYVNGSTFPDYDPGTELVQARQKDTGGTFDTYSNAIYAQDSWAITPTLTVNVGVRWEQYDNRNAHGETFIKIDDQYAPRVGFIWDPSGQGRSKLFASYGQYHLPIAANTNIRLAGMEYDENWWYELIGGINPDGTPVGLGDLIDGTLVSNGIVPDADGVRALNLEPMSQNEFIAGAEQMVGANWSLGARFVWREFNEVIEDMTIDAALSEKYGIEEGAFAYYLANPGKDFEGYYDLDGDGTLDPVSFTAAELGYPDATRDYYAVELTAKRRFASNWMAQLSYTWSQSYGNYEGYVKSDNGQDDAGLTQDFDFAGLMDNAYGFLPNDRRHNFKAYGAYAFDFGLQVGGYLYYHTGRPRNAFAVHPTDIWAQEYGADSHFYVDGTPAPRGSVGTTPDVYGFDVLLKYDFQAAGIDWTVRMDVFNLVDNDAVVEVGEYSGTDSGTPDLSFGQAIYHQTPRRVRLGASVRF